MQCVKPWILTLATTITTVFGAVCLPSKHFLPLKPNGSVALPSLALPINNIIIQLRSWHGWYNNKATANEQVIVVWLCAFPVKLKDFLIASIRNGTATELDGAIPWECIPLNFFAAIIQYMHVCYAPTIHSIMSMVSIIFLHAACSCWGRLSKSELKCNSWQRSSRPVWETSV